MTIFNLTTPTTNSTKPTRDEVLRSLANEHVAIARQLRASHAQQRSEGVPFEVMENVGLLKRAEMHEETATALRAYADTLPQESREAEPRLWLWKNFVDGRQEYWAFDNLYPCHSNGDPMTLGKPCGYAIVKQSHDGSPQAQADGEQGGGA